MHVLYTYGYTGGSLEDLRRCVAAGALVMDIRYSPNSRVPHWRRFALSATLGAGYAWIQALGNRNYRTGPPIAIADLETGMTILRQKLERQPVVLLCACREVHSCHRGNVAIAARAAWPGLRIVHLSPGDALE